MTTANRYALVARSQIHGRADVNYALLSLELERNPPKWKYDAVPLSTVVKSIDYGSSSKASIEPIGYPMLRMNNLQAPEWDLTDLKYLDIEGDEAKKYTLDPGDLIINRTNTKELVGKAAVFREEGTWLFASYLLRVKLDETQALPEFVSLFLGTKQGRLQIDRLSREIAGMTNINTQEIREILIPLPPVDEQTAMVERVGAVLTKRRQHLIESRGLLENVGQSVLQTLNINFDGLDEAQYMVTRKDLDNFRRLDVDYFHPDREAAAQAVEHSPYESKMLSDIVTIVKDQVTRPDVGDEVPDLEYVGLSRITPRTGEFGEADEDDPSGSASLFRKDDVLISRLRPRLNKIWTADRMGRCSPEFRVLRIIDEGVSSDFLAAVLRTTLVLAQLVHNTSGNTHPRVSDEDLLRVKVPVPREPVQEEVVRNVQKHRSNAYTLAGAAATDLEAALEQFVANLDIAKVTTPRPL